jgi:hypothetical protein
LQKEEVKKTVAVTKIQTLTQTGFVRKELSAAKDKSKAEARPCFSSPLYCPNLPVELFIHISLLQNVPKKSPYTQRQTVLSRAQSRHFPQTSIISSSLAHAAQLRNKQTILFVFIKMKCVLHLTRRRSSWTHVKTFIKNERTKLYLQSISR